MAKGLVGSVQMKTRLLQLGYKLPEISMMMPCGSCVRMCEHLHHYLLRLAQSQFFFSAYASCSNLSYNVPYT